MNQQRFAGITYTDPLCLCVYDDGHSQCQIRILIYIDMTVARSRLDHRNGAILHHRPDQSRAASGNQHIHILF